MNITKTIKISTIILIIVLITIPCFATSTFYNNCNFVADVTLHYVNSSWGTPVDNLDGQTVQLYFSSNSERCLLKSPYLSNSSSETIKGYISNNMEFKIPFGGRIEVTQTHYQGNYNDRNATSYYDATVNSIDTVLLNRTITSSNYITIILAIVVAFAIIAFVKVLSK